ncbi:MAG: hypothetical protein ACSHW0_00705 [Thalassotalea sp.]
MKISPKHKPQIIALVIKQLEAELFNTQTSAQQAHQAAVDDQSVAETQYDTLAIEAAYLAEGHSKRIVEIKAAIAQFQHQLNAPEFTDPLLSETKHQQVKQNSLVEIINDDEQRQLLFVGVTAGGKKISLLAESITVITLASPLGKAIKNKSLDDDFSFQAGNKTRSGYIAELC